MDPPNIGSACKRIPLQVKRFVPKTTNLFGAASLRNSSIRYIPEFKTHQSTYARTTETCSQWYLQYITMDVFVYVYSGVS